MQEAILLITGAWHVPQHYHKLVKALEGRGFRVICERLPTNNNSVPPNKTMQDDIEFIKAIVAQETAACTHLTVIGHSWGGMISSGALAEFAVPRDSPKGGVVDLIFMCAFMPKETESLAGVFGGTLPPFLTKEANDLLVWTDPIDHMYNDLDADEAQWADKLRVVHSSTAQHTPLNVAKVAWRIIPLTYIVCEKDQGLPSFLQDMMIGRVEAEGIPVKQYRVAASHSPFLSMPDKVAGIIQEVMKA